MVQFDGQRVQIRFLSSRVFGRVLIIHVAMRDHRQYKDEVACERERVKRLQFRSKM